MPLQILTFVTALSLSFPQLVLTNDFSFLPMKSCLLMDAGGNENERRSRWDFREVQ